MKLLVLTRKKLIVLITIASTILLTFSVLRKDAETSNGAGAVWHLASLIFLTPRFQQGIPISSPLPGHVANNNLHKATSRAQGEDRMLFHFDGRRVQIEDDELRIRSLFGMLETGPEYDDDEAHNRTRGSEGQFEVDASGGKSRGNPYIKPLLSCPYTLNEKTQHFRIPNTRLHRIEFGSPDDLTGGSGRYFNPTFLVLPDGPESSRRDQHRQSQRDEDGFSSHKSRSQPYEYLIFSRLVTAGLHQETHYCPAVTNLSSQDLQCDLPPRRLRLPPTAAYRCEGSWANFAEIPGFHDPRVFWSGKGEPLAIVNSASASGPNGCVGLWIVDLRAASEDINKWLEERLGSRMPESIIEAGELDEETRNRLEPWAKPRMSYPYLTEITKNPPSTRNAVEKNWVLFFPQEDEAWVMYDVIGQGKVPSQSNKTMDKAAPTQEGHNDIPVSTDFEVNSRHMRRDVTNVNRHLANSTSAQAQAELANLPGNTVADSDLDILTSNEEIALRQPAKQAPQTPSHDNAVFNPARTLAKLLGNGATTPNLTSQHESPCFDHTHVYDILGNKGNWHQGSNSLRLVLCQHPKSVKSRLSEVETCILTDENEASLVNEGRIVHFMVLHRKFSNSLKLPMRYERYFLVWEARNPFRLLGVTKHPFLFAGERARPWSEEENGFGTGDADLLDAHKRASNETEKWENAYFSYTPSLAWASTSWGGTLQDGQRKRAKDLGTAYLDDEVIVGIGLDDTQQALVKLKAFDLLSCLRLCPDFAGH